LSIPVLAISFDARNAAQLGQVWAQALHRSVNDVTTEADRLTSLGAQQIRSLAENNNRWISLRDPEGNEFDLVTSR
jgi:predicted enzyme related to lactoylglutathione lyase